MPWPFCSSQQQQQPNDRSPTAKACKRVSFAPDQSTKWPTPPPPPLKPAMKQVRFTSDTTAGFQHRSQNRSRSADTDKTHRPSPPRAKPTPGLSSVRRDFETRKPTGPPNARKPDAQISIPARGSSYGGPPKARHRRPGFEWVSYEVRVTPTGRVK